MSDFIPDPRPIPEELTDKYEHADFVPEPTIREIMAGTTILERLNTADRETLRLWAAGGTGNTTWHHTEIGGE